MRCQGLAAIARERDDTVVVLDNIAKLTMPKRDSCRTLRCIILVVHFIIAGFDSPAPEVYVLSSPSPFSSNISS